MPVLHRKFFSEWLDLTQIKVCTKLLVPLLRLFSMKGELRVQEDEFLPLIYFSVGSLLLTFLRDVCGFKALTVDDLKLRGKFYKPRYNQMELLQ